MEGVIFRLERQKSNFEEEATLKKIELEFQEGRREVHLRKCCLSGGGKLVDSATDRLDPKL